MYENIINLYNEITYFDYLINFHYSVFLTAGFLLMTLSIYLLMASFSIANLFLFQMKSGVLGSKPCLFMHPSNRLMM